MKALVLMHEPDGPAGEVGVRFGQRGFTVETHVITTDYERPNVATGPLPSGQDHDVLAIMGSVRSLTRREEIGSWVEDELDLLRRAQARNQPVLGVCFGAQLLAEALGGSVESSPRAEIGWYKIQPVEGVDCPVGPGPWMQWHHDRFHAPSDAEVMAKSDVGQQVFRIGRSVATQFHPEITVAMLDDWLAACDDDYLAGHGVDPVGIRAETVALQSQSADACHRLVDWFLDDVASS
jgi:GMP synthase-like glutamine amidotransferase